MTKSKRKRGRRNKINSMVLEAMGTAADSLPGDTSDFNFNFRNPHHQLIYDRMYTAYDILARLVIQECVQVVDKTYVSEIVPLDKTVIATRIRRHFGVDTE